MLVEYMNATKSISSGVPALALALYAACLGDDEASLSSGYSPVPSPTGAMPVPTESLPPSENVPAPWVIITEARPLHQAVLSASPQVVEGMLNQGTDINTKADVRNTETDGRLTDATPLHLAALDNPGPAVASLLLDWGADIEAKNDNRWTPLHSAAVWNPEVAGLLLDRGTDIEAKTEDIWTPLHISTAIGIEPTVTELLLDRGTDTNAKTATDSTPCESARHRDRFTGTPLLDRLCRP